MDEIWKDINGYESSYQVSSFGRVRSKDRYINGVTVKGNHVLRKISGRVLKLGITKNGYCIISLWSSSGKTFFVHRLVAETFLNQVSEKLHVNHKDGIKTNNRVGNLEWCTRSENMKHALTKGLLEIPTGANNGRSRQVIDIKSGVVYTTIRETSKVIGCNTSTLGKKLRGTWLNDTNMLFL